MLGPKHLKEMERISPAALVAFVRDWGNEEPSGALHALIDSGVLGRKPHDIPQRIALVDEFMRLRSAAEKIDVAGSGLLGASLSCEPGIDPANITKRAILGLIPLCTTGQGTDMLMHCIARQSIADVAACMDAGADALTPSTATMSLGVNGSRGRRIEMERAAPYAVMLQEFDSKQWSMLEQLHPAITTPLTRIPALAVGGNNGLPSDRKPVDMVSLCFVLDLATPASHSRFRRERLNRVLKRMEGVTHAVARPAGIGVGAGLVGLAGVYGAAGRAGVKSAASSIDIGQVLHGLGRAYVALAASSEGRDKCLMLAQVLMLAGDAGAPWVRSLCGKEKQPAAGLLHDLARCGSSNLTSDSDRTLVVAAIRRLVQLGFPVDAVCSTDKVTPLMVAAECAHIENMAALIEMGSDPDARDAKGHTARGHARKAGVVSAIEFLDAQKSRLAINAALPTYALPFN